jgi:YgiT-type zinc finger domain-containing protein
MDHAMKCALCKQGETSLGEVTVTLQRGETTVIFKGVPADVCENCGEYYLSESIARQVTQRAEEAVKSGAEVEILRFAA